MFFPGSTNSKALTGAVILGALACLECSVAWVGVTPSGTPPPNRWQHSAVYNPTSRRMIVYAGKVPSTQYGADVWVLVQARGPGKPQWIQLQSVGGAAPGRHEHSAVYDARANRMVVFGGHANPGPFTADLWVLENADGLGGAPKWTQLRPAGAAPGAREWHSAVYDAASRRMIVFGGLGAGPLNDLWVLENATGSGGAPKWTQLTPSGGPPPARVAHTAVYDASSNKMVVFGGSAAGGFSAFLNDTWVLENANGLGGNPKWVRVNAAGTLPPARENHVAAADGTGGMLIFGGWTTSQYFNDVWRLAFAFGGGSPRWLKLTPKGVLPKAREAATAIFDSSTRRLILFGGSFSPPVGVPPSARCHSGSCLNDLWALPR